MKQKHVKNRTRGCSILIGLSAVNSAYSMDGSLPLYNYISGKLCGAESSQRIAILKPICQTSSGGNSNTDQTQQSKTNSSGGQGSPNNNTTETGNPSSVQPPVISTAPKKPGKGTPPVYRKKAPGV